MSKKQFSEVFIQRLFPLFFPYGYCHIFQSQSLHVPDPGLFCTHANQPRSQFCHLMSQFFCHNKPRAIASCTFIRDTACSQDYLICIQTFSIRKPHSADNIILRQHLIHSGPEPYFNFQFFQCIAKCFDHIRRFVRSRKHTAASLYF